jgi:transcription elongation factor B polypeptide 3
MVVMCFEAIGEVGGVPYSILEPVLLKCSAVQLFHIEECNPYFLSDTDDLWKTHCQRDFKASEPRVGQTWRELYLSKHNEREEKFKSLTKRIGKRVEAFQKEQKEKQIKLAKASSMKPKRSGNSVSLTQGSSRPSFQAGSIPKAHPMMTKVKKMISQQRMKGWRPC